MVYLLISPTTRIKKERSASITKDTDTIRPSDRPLTPTAETLVLSIITEKIVKENGERFNRLYYKGRFIGKV
jgi:hypothetical protein